MTDAREVLSRSKTVVAIDWPSQEVPELLAAAGFAVYSHEGPGDDEWYLYEADTRTRVSAPPDTGDVVYTYRPADELPGIVEFAQTLGAHTIWFEEGRRDRGAATVARRIVEGAGLAYLDEPYIVDALGNR
jgi:predicted CoA-binding protein